ncbi:MAG: NUDIX domain-containing protein [Planctomycetia bacterium]|nr:NUDIX domain-containing protein [Planctomycetia bacterium]
MSKREGSVRQAAVVAIRSGRICLITSSSGKRWLVPKGNHERGAKLRQTALQEAWEEAGLVGWLKPAPLGNYEFEKLGRVHRVVVFRMTVTDVKQRWPERHRRQRRWLRPHDALPLIEHAKLRKILSRVLERRAG